MMVLCGDGFMDFIESPKSKELKSRRFGSWLCFRPQVNGGGEDKNTPSHRWWRLALSKGPNWVGVLLFSHSIHLRTEAEPATETSWF
jgi:hypothetical protein